MREGKDNLFTWQQAVERFGLGLDVARRRQRHVAGRERVA